MNGFSIRPAGIDDVESLYALIRELAVYEKLEHRVTGTAEDLRGLLFGGRPAAEAILVWAGDEAVGFAVFYTTISTFSAKPGIYVEDIFVRAEHRGRGFGKAMLTWISRVAGERGCDRLSWQVLDWNRPAIDFYERIGATHDGEWLNYELGGEPLARLQQHTETTPWD